MGGTRPGAAGAPSIIDVARLAGVSSQTVSRVSRGAPNVSDRTRELVLQAMDKLGYTPNKAAQALRSGAFHTIGVLTQQIQRTGEAWTTSGVLEAAAQAGYTVVMAQVAHPDGAEMGRAVGRLAQQSIDGLVIVQAGTATAEHLALPAGLPVASSDSALAGRYPSASADQVQGVREAMSHLLGLGHRTVHHIAGPADSRSAHVRSAAWAHCLAEAGIAAPEPVSGGWEASDGYAAGLELAGDPEVTAVLCANDEVALGLIRALHESGRRVPEDVSVVGFDGLPLGEYAFPPLTTVQQDFRRAGAEMVRLVLAQAQGRPLEESHVIIPTRLVVRASTAAPPA
ncbi:LacI family DNA-binding transcriptional regulator [Propionibacterium acidifaciens]|uniref:LacI family DNA-binding transcriptional regulator n=2 Tax=Propionibacterium acidifaciens TaxID=556499 RepID=UPI00040D9637|nr:LacI family DNA-binding transcriptional regulator [Propionibacterium acidifaciens]